MSQKLYIYDSGSEEDRDQAEARFDDDDDVRKVGVASKTELLAALSRLVVERAAFNRVLIQSHGGPGHLKLTGGSIWDTTLRSDFTGKSFHMLFPTYTRIYFDGCNVAGDPFGTQLLDAAGEVFLKLGGGEVFGYTSPGYGITWDIPFIGGHTIHFSGQLRKVHFNPGGTKRPEPVQPARDPFDDRGTRGRGFKV